MNDIEKSHISIDKISKTLICPPELRYIIDQPGNHYRSLKK